MTVATVLRAKGMTRERRSSMEHTIRDYLLRRGVDGLVRVVMAPDPFSGAERLVGAYGLGSVVPNTILLGDSEETTHREAYCRMIEGFHEARRNLLIVHDRKEGDSFGERKRIDVWWGGLQRNGGLMVILAYLMRTSLAWRGAKVYLKLVVPTESAAERARVNLDSIVARTRTGARSEVLVSGGRAFDEILRESSGDADLVFLGLAEPKGDFVSYYERIRRRLRGLPTTVLVLAAEDVAFGEVLLEPE